MQFYFVISALATTGNLPPSCDGPTTQDCSLGVRGYIWGLYIVVGVPIFAIYFGRITMAFIVADMELKERKILLRKLTDKEYYFAASFLSFANLHKIDTVYLDLHSGGAIPTKHVSHEDVRRTVLEYNNHSKNTINFAEYVILMIVRLGKVDLYRLDEIKEIFHAIDIENTG